MKVLVGSPVSKHHEYCMEQYVEMLKGLNYSNYDILLIDNSDTHEFYLKWKEKVPMVRYGYDEKSTKAKLVACRNYLHDYALKNNYDYFMDIDQDVLPPKDVIERLISHRKDYVTGIYYNYFKNLGQKVKMAVAYAGFSNEEGKKLIAEGENLKETNPSLHRALIQHNWDYKKLIRPLNEQEIASGKLLPILSSGSGCMLISKKALEALAFRNNPGSGFDDVIFCNDLREKGFELFADCSVICEHLTEQRPWKWVNKGNQNEIEYR